MDIFLDQIGAWSAQDQLFIATGLIVLGTIVAYWLTRSLGVAAVVALVLTSLFIWLSMLPMWVILILVLVAAVMIKAVFSGRKEGV